jgi:hypothetical protein
MYARGMSVREIRGHLEELYGIDVSPDLISAVTDAVLEEVAEWQNRPLDACFPLVFFDTIRVKIRDAEYQLLASGRALIGVNSTDAHLHAETLPRSVWDPDGDPELVGIAAVVAVHRLREVACLYGFTRFEARAAG